MLCSGLAEGNLAQRRWDVGDLAGDITVYLLLWYQLFEVSEKKTRRPDAERLFNRQIEHDYLEMSWLHAISLSLFCVTAKVTSTAVVHGDSHPT